MLNYKRWLLVCLGYCLLGLAACRPGWVAYNHEALGLSLELPADWEVTVDYQDDLSSALSVRPPQDGVGAVQIFLTPHTQALGLAVTGPAEYLQFFLEALAGDEYVVKNPVTTTQFQARPAATAALLQGEMTIQVTTWESESAYVTVMVFDADGPEGANLARLAATIQLTEESTEGSKD